jgi:hypothetical protein
MKKLLENWNNFLNEAIDPRIQKQIDAILALPDIGVLVSSDWDGSMAFRYIRIVDKDRKRYSILTSRNTDVPNGYIEIYDASSKKAKHLSGGGACLGGWIVVGSIATTGFGPLLYELAVEWASQNGAGLTPDRTSVSTYAGRVWAKYMTRPDIEKKQLDAIKADEVPRLTRPVADDCSQRKSIDAAGENWMNSPFSKMYSKSNTEVLDALRAAGRIIEE